MNRQMGQFRQLAPLTRLLLVLFMFNLALTCGIVIYGLIRYPVAPIERREDGQYRDKWGKIYTAEEYQDYQTWLRTGCIVGPLNILLGGTVALTGWLERRKRKDTDECVEM